MSHLLLDHVVPRCLVRCGETVLHASAIRIAGRAIAFIGPTGAGKSTLAVALAQLGADLLTDDCVAVRQGEAPLAFASYPGVRLWPESIEALGVSGPQTAVIQASNKRRLSPAGTMVPASMTGVPLREICVLDTSAELARGDPPALFEPLVGGAAFLALYTHSFRMDTGERVDLIAEANRAAALASRTTVLNLRLSQRLDDLRAGAAAVLDHLSSASFLGS